MSKKYVMYENGKMSTSDEGGGGGGSTVTITPTLQSGTKIADFSIDGNSGELYAPQGGGSGGVSDVQVDGASVVNPQGVAEITMPVIPSVPDKLGDLSDVEISNPSLNNILMYSNSKWRNESGFPYVPVIYSDEEREVGVWRDGKPLYQKSFKFINNVDFGNGKVFDTGISNMDFGFVKNAIFYDYAQNRYENVPFYQGINTSATPSSYMQVGVQSNTGKIVLRTNANWTANNNRYLIVTLEYTKTTDTAGSGKWTTSGVPTHHYSTNEQVVGTWIDGKPLYEKTYDYPITSQISAGTKDLVALTVERPIRYWGYMINSSTGRIYPVPFQNGNATTNFRYNESTNSIALVVANDSWGTSYHLYFTVQYTKTTD